MTSQTTPEPNEEERQAVLNALRILDTASDWRYDCVTALAMQIFGAPMAAISLIDQTRQWFKSQVGIGVSETTREIAFCDHVIRQTEPMLVEDATEDPRFVDNPLVTGAMRVKFYAGAPIQVWGQNVGTVCALDRRSNEATKRQLGSLALLANLTAAIMESDIDRTLMEERIQCLEQKLKQAAA